MKRLFANWGALSVFLLVGSSLPADPHFDKETVGRFVNFSHKKESLEKAQKTADGLRRLVDDLNYSDAFRKFFGEDYAESACNANRYLASKYSPEELSKVIDIKKDELKPRQRLALKFFFGGLGLSKAQFEILMGEDQKDLINALKAQRFLIHEEGEYRLNNLCLNVYELTQGAQKGPIYLFTDLPRNWAKGKVDPEDRITSTSLSLLKTLESRQANRGPVKGYAADLGSGGGIQSIALLKMNPGIKHLYGLEVIPHSMNLSRFNAMLNGVSDRFTPIDNMKSTADGKTDELRKALKGKRLAIAVSNPPFNIIPKALHKVFWTYGYGGPDGLAITRILARQAVANLDKNGEILFYGQFAEDKDGNLLFNKMLRNEIPPKTGFHVSYLPDPVSHLNYWVHIRDLDKYSEETSDWLKKEFPSEDLPRGVKIPDKAAFKKALQDSGVAELSTEVILMEAKPDEQGYRFDLRLRLSPFDFEGALDRKGGIYERYEFKGGVRIEANLNETPNPKATQLSPEVLRLLKMVEPETLMEVLSPEDLKQFISSVDVKLYERFKKTHDSDERIKIIRQFQEKIK